MSRNSGASAGKSSMFSCTTSRFGNPSDDLSEVIFQAAYHHVIEHPL